MNTQLETSRITLSVQRWRDRRALRHVGPRVSRATFRPVSETAPSHFVLSFGL